MKIQTFRCAICQGAAAAVGFYCLCVGAENHQMPSYAPEIASPVAMAPEHWHTTEANHELELKMKPAAAVTTSSSFVPRMVNAFSQFGETPASFVVRPLNTLVTILTQYPTSTTSSS